MVSGSVEFPAKQESVERNEERLLSETSDSQVEHGESSSQVRCDDSGSEAERNNQYDEDWEEEVGKRLEV